MSEYGGRNTGYNLAEAIIPELHVLFSRERRT